MHCMWLLVCIVCVGYRYEYWSDMVWRNNIKQFTLTYVFNPGQPRARNCWFTMRGSPAQHDPQWTSVCGNPCGHGLFIWGCFTGHAETRAECWAGVTQLHRNLDSWHIPTWHILTYSIFSLNVLCPIFYCSVEHQCCTCLNTLQSYHIVCCLWACQIICNDYGTCPTIAMFAW